MKSQLFYTISVNTKIMAFLEFLQNEFVRATIILFTALIAVLASNVLLKKYVKHLTGKTKTEIDDIILAIITKPLFLLIILAGIYFALNEIRLLQQYTQQISSLFFTIAVFIVAFLLARVLTVLITQWMKIHKRFEKTPQVLNKMIRVIIYVLALLMVLDHLNIEITPLIATLGIGGLAVGLALQNTLSNFFAGLHIISDRPVNVGDYIELDGKVEGYVEDIGWRSTRIKTLPNTIIIIPNSKLAESVITNYSMPDKEIAVLVQCGVAYGSDLEKVEKATVDVARKIQKTVNGAVKDFEPFIRYHTFADSNINFTVILRAEKFVNKYLIKHEFIKALKARYDKEEIEISWPVRKIYTAE